MWRMIPYWLRRSEGVRLPLRGKSIMNPGISRQKDAISAIQQCRRETREIFAA